jgi:DNA-directed RNA polymerase specialized sigma24 family protein
LEELYRLYCDPVYAFIRRRGHGRQDAQDLTQDFFVHLLAEGTLGRAEPQRGRFRNFLLGALDHFLANAAERAGAGKRGGGCQWVFLDDDTVEDRLTRVSSARRLLPVRSNLLTSAWTSVQTCTR